jgi:hypothetical protein
MGRMSLLMVMGVSVLFLFSNKFMANISVESLDNAMAYYENTQRYNIAIAGANFACGEVFRTPNWRTGFSNVPLNGGTFSVTVTDTGQRMVRIVSIGTFQGTTQSVWILLSPSSFGKFAFYGGVSASSAAWESGDTIGGPNHTQGTLNTYNSPVFLGKTTTKTGLYMSGTKNPKFLGGYETGVNIAMPNNYVNIDSAAAANGRKQAGGELYLNFQADGTVKWKTSATGVETTSPLSTFAPNGVINVLNGNLYLQGTVKGRLTVAATRSSSGGSNGSVFIQNNLTYSDDPRTNPDSEDLLGVVGYGDVTIMDNAATQFTVMGSMFSYKGGLAVQNYTTRPSGTLTILGGIIAEKLYATSNGLTGTSRRGYNMSIKYDDRLMTQTPPQYPGTGGYEVLSWLE